MAKPPVADNQSEVAVAPSEVRVTVFRLEAPHHRLPVRFQRIAVAVLGIALAVALLELSWSGGSGSLVWGVRQAGPAGVAAAYGYPTNCLRVRISAINPAFARADFERPGSCSDAIAFPTALFHRFEGEWHPVLYAVGYPCPVPSVPASVQKQLDLCGR